MLIQDIIITALHIGHYKLVITTGPKNFHFGLPKDVDTNFKYQIDPIEKHNEPLPEHTIKNKIRQLLFKNTLGSDINERGKQKTNEPHKFFPNLL